MNNCNIKSKLFHQLKILMITDVFFPDTIGGSGRVAYHLSHEINKKEHTVHIVTRGAQNRCNQYQKINENFHVYRFSAPRHESTKFILSEVLGSYLLVRHLIALCDYDLICIHQCFPAIGPSFTGIFSKSPLIYFYHSPWHKEFLIRKDTHRSKCSSKIKVIGFLMRLTEEWMLSKAARGFVLSEYMLQNLHTIHQKAKTEISILPGGIDLDRFKLSDDCKESIRTKIKLPEEKKIFLTVRNLSPRMGIDKLIEAFNHSPVLRKNSLLVIGGTGPSESRLRSLAECYDLKHKILFLGHIPEEDLVAHYQAADFFILPTVQLEGFGLVILEAMACGTPVFGTPVGAIPEILGKFDHRMLFRGSDWRDIKDKLEQAIKYPDQFHFAPERCREFVEQNYSWKKMADSFEKEALRLIHRKNQHNKTN